MQKNPDYEMWKAKNFPVLAKIRIKNPYKPKIFIKKKLRNHSYHQFHPVLAKIRINRIRINGGLLYFKTDLLTAITVFQASLCLGLCALCINLK